LPDAKFIQDKNRPIDCPIPYRPGKIYWGSSGRPKVSLKPSRSSWWPDTILQRLTTNSWSGL